MKKTEIIPAIIGRNYLSVDKQIRILENRTEWVHLDVADSIFVPDSTWGSLEDLRFLEGPSKIEVHLMIDKPEKVVADWTEVADRIIFHLEATNKASEIIESVSASSAEVGLALLLSTPIDRLEPLLSSIDFVQLMSIEQIGRQGYAFDNRVLEKVKHLRTLAPSVTIQLDGGLNFETIPSVIEAGADRLVVGSAIWKSPDPLATLEDFKNAFTRGEN